MKNIYTYEEFENIVKQDLVVIIAKTKTCAVCKPLTDKLSVFMKKYPTIPAYQIYLEDIVMFSGQHLVFSVPTILVFSHNQEMLRESRFIDFDKIERLFSIYLDN
ncbi:MAG: thioredoxin family protein [Tenericutes bacterium]|nr:thioredoxin family protein [Mycoplasmatota bacterium]